MQELSDELELSGEKTKLDEDMDDNGRTNGHQSTPNYNTYYNTYNNSSSTTNEGKETEANIRVENNTTALNASKQKFLQKFEKLYPSVYIRQADIKELNKTFVSAFTLNNLSLWNYYVEHTNDKYISKSKSLDLILLLRNQAKFEKELKSISYNEPNIKNSLIIGAIDLDKLNSELKEYKFNAVLTSVDNNWQKIDIYNPDGKMIDYNEASLTRLSKYEWTKEEIKELINCN